MRSYFEVVRELLILVLTIIVGAVNPALADEDSKVYQDEAKYVYEKLDASPDGLFDLSDDRQYQFLLNTLRRSNSECIESTRVLRDLAELRANHIRFGGPGKAHPYNDDNPDGIIEPYNESTALFNLNEEKTLWGATALSSVPGGSEYSCVTLQIHYVGPGVNLPIGEASSVDLSCGVNFQLTSYTDELSEEEVAGLDSGNFRLIPRLTYVYRKIDGPARAGTGQFPPVSANVPLEMTVLQPTQMDSNKGKPYIKICINRSQQNDCDYAYTSNNKSVILPLEGQVIYNAEIADPTDPTSMGFASVTAVNTTTGGNCVEPNGIDSNSFFNNPNTSWNTGGGTILKWNIADADLGRIVGCANNGASMDFVQVMTLQLISPNDVQYPLSTSITSEADKLAGPSTFIMPYLETYSGCLAEETQITLADGKGTLNITSEDLFENSNPVKSANAPDGKLWVQGNTIGLELKLSYKVTDDKGNSVIMTENHPIYAANPGQESDWVFAKNLQTGATLQTLDGPSKVVSIEQINYENKVYNLFVQNEDGSKVPFDQQNFYANNILVGDGSMQTTMVQEEHGLNCSQ